MDRGFLTSARWGTHCHYPNRSRKQHMFTLPFSSLWFFAQIDAMSVLPVSLWFFLLLSQRNNIENRDFVYTALLSAHYMRICVLLFFLRSAQQYSNRECLTKAYSFPDRCPHPEGCGGWKASTFSSRIWSGTDSSFRRISCLSVYHGTIYSIASEPWKRWMFSLGSTKQFNPCRWKHSLTLSVEHGWLFL